MLSVYLFLNCAVLALMVIFSIDQKAEHTRQWPWLLSALVISPVLVLIAGAWQLSKAAKEEGEKSNAAQD